MYRLCSLNGIIDDACAVGFQKLDAPKAFNDVVLHEYAILGRSRLHQVGLVGLKAGVGVVSSQDAFFNTMQRRGQ